MTIIKLTSDAMRGIASSGHSTVDDYDSVHHQIAALADDLATTGMQGMAGPAFAAKAADLRAKVAQHANDARDRFHAIGNFANATDEAEASRQAIIHGIQVV